MINAVFNLNSHVTVTLTEMGIQILEDRWNYSCDRFPGLDHSHFENKLKEIRNNGGVYRDQMHSIINIFGDHIGLGKKLPFETDIVVELYESDNIELALLKAKNDIDTDKTYTAEEALEKLREKRVS